MKKTKPLTIDDIARICADKYKVSFQEALKVVKESCQFQSEEAEKEGEEIAEALRIELLQPGVLEGIIKRLEKVGRADLIDDIIEALPSEGTH